MNPVRKKTRLNIIGQRNYDGIAGEWVFYVTFYLAGVGNMEAPRGLEGAFIMEAAVELQGTATGKMLDLAEERKKKEEEEKRKIKPVFTPKRTTPRPTPTRTDSEYIRNYEPNPRDLYKCEFEADLKGSLMNVGPTTVYGGIGIEDQWTHVEENFIDPGMTVEDTGKVTMYIDSKDNVSVSLELQGEEYGPFRGVFTCEEDLEIQRKDSGTWPIWGVWTDRNPYEPMPDFEKDFETVQGQVRKGETPKKVNYPEGRWLMFDKGSKDKPRRYSILEVSSEDVVYETGELWPYPGSVMFKPDYKVIASKDLTVDSGKFSPPEYDLAVTYNDASDTLVHPFLGTLVRVRNVKIVGIWSSISDQLMPDIEDVAEIPEGTWYEFKKNTDKEDDTIWGISAAYTFSRIISDKDNGVEIDKGLAIMMPIQDNEFVQLTKIQCEKIAPDGTVTRFEKEDESVVVSEYGKGQIKFNMMQYYSVSSLNLKGKWSTVIPPVDPPDAEEGIYEVWDENGNAVYSAENATR